MTDLNADLTEPLAVETAAMDWAKSPAPGVLRKRIMLRGDAEKGAVTSVVRYEPGAAFPSHGHPEGEEIFVMEGVFSDETGDYGPGSFLLNPPGFSHAPFTKESCTIFVRLRQYAGEDRPRIARDTIRGHWKEEKEPGIGRMGLYAQDGRPERIQLELWQPGAKAAHHTHGELVELFVLDGVFEDEHGAYPVGSFIRAPIGSSHAPFSTKGCMLYAKVGTPEGM
jgi:anti-sigma factor ChrR (cupin superfamily)